jgi:hypothetical protein
METSKTVPSSYLIVFAAPHFPWVQVTTAHAMQLMQTMRTSGPNVVLEITPEGDEPAIYVNPSQIIAFKPQSPPSNDLSVPARSV